MSVHPGGRGTEVFPVNANEAAARRAARFDPNGMRGNQIEIQAPRIDARTNQYPITMDLRKV